MSEVQWVRYFGPNTFEAEISLDVDSRPWQDGHVKVGQTAVQCLGCKTIIPFSDCPNCGHSNFKYGYSQSDRLGVFCGKCDKGSSSIKCECGTANPISIETIVQQKKGGCFIATAAYGSDEAPDVLVLRSFRDHILLPSPRGRVVVRLYYMTSPPVARYLLRHPIVRASVRRGILQPIATLCRSRLAARFIDKRE